MVIDAIKYLERQKRLIQEGKTNWTTVEKIEQSIEYLEERFKEKLKEERGE